MAIFITAYQMYELINLPKLGWKPDTILLGEQTHGNNIFLCKKPPKRQGIIGIPNVDGFITTCQNIALVIKTADCIPVLLYEKEIIGAVHAGRKGVYNGILISAINAMQKEDAAVQNIKISFGPGISAPHYAVDIHTYTNFVRETTISQKYPLLNLKKVLLHQAISRGITSQNITDHDTCTYESTEYYSYRRNKTKKRQISAIMLKP